MPASCPPSFTVRVPPLVSEAWEKLGYGIGMGPAGGEGGERQTSGIAAIDWLPLFFAETSIPLANTLSPIVSYPSDIRLRSLHARRCRFRSDRCHAGQGRRYAGRSKG